jgi:hypothetical protein
MVWFWVTWVRVDIYKIWFYICRVVRKPQLGKSSGSNRRYSTRKESWPCSNIVVKKWNWRFCDIACVVFLLDNMAYKKL